MSKNERESMTRAEQYAIMQGEINEKTQLAIKLQAEIEKLKGIRSAAQNLFDNRLGWSDGRNPYAHPEFWNQLEQALKENNE